ncbi:unnamed protein product [Alopecurus aequalis]
MDGHPVPPKKGRREQAVALFPPLLHREIAASRGSSSVCGRCGRSSGCSAAGGAALRLRRRARGHGEGRPPHFLQRDIRRDYPLFTQRELGVSWDVELYGELLKIGGGKERMTAYFNKTEWPAKARTTDEERTEFVASLHKRKTELFMALIEKKLLPLRPGVQRLIDEALGKGVKVAVCSTSNEKAVSAIVSCLLGPDRAEKITIFAGDVVPRKKPDPAIYLLAATTLEVDPSSCVVVEDSNIGLSAAKAAGMKCIVTKSGYTSDEDFVIADAVFDCIGDPPEGRFDLQFCANLLQKQFVS